MATDLQMAFVELAAKKRLYDNLWNYYEGEQPLIYSRERLREIFSEINARFTQNWCAVVVDSALERIQFREYTVSDNETAEEKLRAVSDANELTLVADDVHMAALVCGEAFVIAELSEDGPQAYYNDPRLCHVFYESSNPRKMRFAAKWWQDDNEFVRMNLYYPDRIEYYVTRSEAVLPDGRAMSPENAPSVVQNADALIPADPPVASSEYSRIPIFHFRRDHRAIRSELVNIIEPQDGLNKLLNDMMVAAEFGAFKQRWIITQAEIGKLKNNPSEIWRIPPAADGDQPVTLGEFSPTDLNNYLVGIDKFANAIAIISRTPKHYFMNVAGAPSGESLIAMEAPLNKKCQKYIDRFTATWRKLGAFLLELSSIPVEQKTISPTFDKPETVQPRTEAEIRQMDVTAGLPLVTVLRDAGWTDAEIETMQKDKQAAQQAAQDAMGFNPSETAATIGAAQRLLQNGGR